MMLDHYVSWPGTSPPTTPGEQHMICLWPSDLKQLAKPTSLKPEVVLTPAGLSQTDLGARTGCSFNIVPSGLNNPARQIRFLYRPR